MIIVWMQLNGFLTYSFPCARAFPLNWYILLPFDCIQLEIFKFQSTFCHLFWRNSHASTKGILQFRKWNGCRLVIKSNVSRCNAANQPITMVISINETNLYVCYDNSWNRRNHSIQFTVPGDLHAYTDHSACLCSLNYRSSESKYAECRHTSAPIQI